MKKLLLCALALAGASTLCAETTTLFSGNQAVTWENTLYIEASAFANAEIGDLLTVTIAEGATDVMELKADGQWLPGSILTWLNDRTQVSAYLTDGMKHALKTYGLELCGPNFTVTSVTLADTDKYVPDGAVWAGFFWIDGGWNTLELYKTAFNNQQPQKIIVNFSDEAEASKFALNVLTAWDNDAMKLYGSVLENTASVSIDVDPETFGNYFEGNNALMVQCHVEEGNSFNITSIVVEPYNTPTGVVAEAVEAAATVDVYNMLGVRVKAGVSAAEATRGLAPGIYVVGNRKVCVR